MTKVEIKIIKSRIAKLMECPLRAIKDFSLNENGTVFVDLGNKGTRIIPKKYWES
jgi:hypothetical protein